MTPINESETTNQIFPNTTHPTQVYGPLSPVDDEGYNRWRSISGNNYYDENEEEKEKSRENSIEGIASRIIDELDASGTTIVVRNRD